MKSMGIPGASKISLLGSAVTAPWAGLLKRLLDIVDMLAKWNEAIIERLYCETNGEVDKPFPVVGDILAIYLVADRLYSGSPQGWYVVSARQLKRPIGTNFYCYAQFHPDIIPIPDLTVPWKGPIDPWIFREKLSLRPIWVRLTTSETNGCSYYNLSDWMKAKRSIHDQAVPGRKAPALSPAKSRPSKRNKRPSKSITPAAHRPSQSSSKKVVRRSWVTQSMPDRKKRRKLDEYVYCTSDSESSSDDNRESIRAIAISLGPILTTGKVQSGFSSGLASTTASVGSTPRAPAKRGADVSSSSVGTMPKYMEEAGWVTLRESTQQELLSLLGAKGDAGASWLVDLSFRLEQAAVFAKCLRNKDRYEGLARAVGGILKRFECLSDAIETLVPVDDVLRAHLEQTETESFTNDVERLTVTLAEHESPFAFL